MEIFKIFGTIACKNQEANQAIEDTTEKAKTLGKEIESAGKESDNFSGKIDEKSKFGVASVFMGNMLSRMATEAGKLVTTLAKSGVGLAGELEQSIGGVETLFGDAASTVFKNADNAYKTAGMNANQYMQTVTTFAAALKQSVETEEEAARIADMAIIDMSDNANKMGSDMASIQNAYQGFAKQNFTMLDNLKLGYGGTQEEMKRLLEDAGKLSNQEYDITSLSDIFEAIHVIQKEMGIAGTTAQEASTTLSGSASSAKAAWDNFISNTMLTAIPKLTEMNNRIIEFAENNPETIQKIADSISGFASISFDAIQGAMQFLLDHGKGVGVALATIAAGAVAAAVVTHPFAASIMAVAAGLSYLKARSDDLKTGEVFGKYSEEELSLLQKWVDIQKEISNARIEGAQNGIAPEDNARMQEAISLANQYNQEIRKIDGLREDYTEYNRMHGGDDDKGIWVDVPAQVSEDSEANMQTELDGMTLEATAKIYPDLSEVYAAQNTAMTIYADIVPRSTPETGARADGSHAKGLDFVPRDGYLARLHYGEAVLNRTTADMLRGGGMSGDVGRLEAIMTQLLTLTRQIVANTAGGKQVVLDSGVLVGQLAPALDMQLGTMAGRKGRRN